MENKPVSPWTQADAIQLCSLVEDVCPLYGCHVALTGGSLYKPGLRKDCDILFYRVRQEPKIDYDGLMKKLESIGFVILKKYGYWLTKAEFNGKRVDMFFPEDDQPKSAPEKSSGY